MSETDLSRPLYRAIGWIRGELVPLEPNPTQFELMTAEGGDRIPLARFIKKGNPKSKAASHKTQRLKSLPRKKHD